MNETMLGKETGKGSCGPEHAMGHCRVGKSPTDARSPKGKGCGTYRFSKGQEKLERGREEDRE